MDTLTASLQKHGKSLFHYGVPGMKWGVRKRDRSGGSRSAPSGPVEPTVARRKGGSIDLRKTQGGQGFEPHPDARSAARSNVIAKRSGVAALSNAELKALVDRMNLENNYAKAMAARQPTKSSTRQLIDKVIKAESGTLLRGQKPKTVEFVETIVDVNKKRKAARAAGATGRALVKAIAARS